MHYEVEQKYRVGDLAHVRAKLIALGASAGPTVEQADCYYRHPARDLAATDEAFRLRRVGALNFMTYKGPKIDATTKSRFEREAPLGDGAEAFEATDEILRRLGFEHVAVVRKRRETLTLFRDEKVIEAALDDVEGVGTFVELELSVNAPEGCLDAVEAAKHVLALVAALLKLVDVERRSYLELLLAAQGG